MPNRFLAHEVYEEWFEGRITRKQWQKVVEHSRGMADFRSVLALTVINEHPANLAFACDTGLMS